MTTNTRSPETNGGVVTSWLAVTSAWPRVSQCSTEIYSQVGNGEGLAAIAFDPLFGKFISTQITCLPPIATSWWNQVLQTPLQTITSIGPLVCPQLYTTATTSALNPASTFVACCPSNYVFQQISGPGTIGQCTSSLPVGQNFSYMSGDTVLESWVPATTLITASGGNVYGVPVNGYIFATTTTATSVRETSSSDTSAPTSVSTSTPKNVPMNVPARVGLSSGARVGIGIGVTLVILWFCALFTAWWLIRRQRRKVLKTDGLIKNDSRVPLHDICGRERSVFEMDVVLKTPKAII